jgi:hypothetical protein
MSLLRGATSYGELRANPQRRARHWDLGKAVQIAPMKPMLKPPAMKRHVSRTPQSAAFDSHQALCKNT